MGVKDLKLREEFDQELCRDGNKFLLFYSAWDAFSIEFTPAFEKLAVKSPGCFCKVSTDNLPEVAAEFSVEVVPTVLFFRNGRLDNRLDGKPDQGLTAESLAEFVWLCRGIV